MPGIKPKFAHRTRKDGNSDQRLTVCTDCKFGIFPFHRYIWTKRGLVHKECDEIETKRS